MEKKLVLFLDFDGVLHPDATYLVRGRPILRADGHLFMWADRLITLLAHSPNVDIVLSTSWVRDLGFSRARAYLPVELQHRVVGATWHSAMGRNADGFKKSVAWWDNVSRYEQIRRWVDRADVQNWIAVDDQPSGWAVSDLSNLIQTDSDVGLSGHTSFFNLSMALQNLASRQ
ncbi:HAD domain-containing protein [Janthinobacterium sp. SUN137]|uniref:HAD domain-containing protein n=1 Tax=Janthinobacterium sp. SUN137 TaxID=3014789 RepID=UPI00271433AB|nr:HAD domain-containing protein [Janthinobacterium sp. SUN137]MDO8038377.1 HAD domain-containing protein [Janthinobacterium sp. SUN137]